MDGPVRDALVVQTYRLSRSGRERDALDVALRALVTIRDSRLMLPLRGVRLCRALDVRDSRPAEEEARRSGVLPFHSDDVLDRAAAELLLEVEKLISTPRRAGRTFGRVLKLYPRPKLGAVDAPTLRLIRRLATGVRAKRRGEREK